MEPFTIIVKKIIGQIPRGKVATYGQIAALAGNPRAARQVVRILHSSTEKDKLAWHRVVNSHRRIALPPGSGYELQQALLVREGVRFGIGDLIDFERFRWKPIRKDQSVRRRPGTRQRISERTRSRQVKTR